MLSKNRDLDRSLIGSNIFFEPLIFKEYPYRLFLLFLYYSLYATSQITLTTYSATVSMFHISHSLTIIYSYICPIVWVLCTIPTIIIIKRVNNNQKIIRLACILMAAGSGLKIGSEISPAFIVLGQICSAFGISLIARSNAKICYNWWALGKRDILVQVHDTAVPIGFSIGFIIPGLYELNQGGTKSYLVTEAVTISACAVLAFIFFKDKPRTPPSKFSEFEVPEIIPSLKSYFTNWNFVIIFICYSFIMGVTLTLMIYFPPIIAKFGYNIAPINVAVGIFLLLGLIVGFLLAVLRGKYKDPLILTLLQISALIGSVCMFVSGLANENQWLLYFGMLLCISFLIPLPGCFFSVLTNFVYEYHEALVSAVFTTGGSLVSLILGGILAKLMTEGTTQTFYGILIVPTSLLICMLLLLLLRK